MLHVTPILLYDTVLFLVLGNALSRSSSVEDILTYFLRKFRWQVFVLFPWFAVLLVLAQLGRELYWHNRRFYSVCLWLLNDADDRWDTLAR